MPFHNIASKFPTFVSKVSNDKIVAAIPLMLQAVLFMVKSRKVTRIDDPMFATWVGVKLIAGACKPQLPYPMKCVVLASQTVVTANNRGDATSLALLVAIANYAMEE